MSLSPAKFYRIDVTMKHGFKYSVFCGSRQLAGTKKSSDDYWTEKIEVREVTEEEYQKSRWDYVEPEPVEEKKKPKVEKPKSKKQKLPQFSKLEDFFEDESESKPTVKPKRKKK